MTRTEETGKPSNYGPKTLQILNSTVDHQRRFDPRKAEEFLVDLSKDNRLVARLQEYFPENCRRDLAKDNEDPEEALRCFKLQKKYLRERLRETAARESQAVIAKKEVAYKKISLWLKGEVDIQTNPGYYHRKAVPVTAEKKVKAAAQTAPNQEKNDEGSTVKAEVPPRLLYVKDINFTRELMCAFCGIMGLNYQETTDFFWKVAFQPPFKQKVWTEVIYYYFAKLHPPADKNWYAAAQDLITELEVQMHAAPDNISPVNETRQLTFSISDLKSTEELKNFLLENRSSFRLNNFNYSARTTIRSLYKKCLCYAQETDPEISTAQKFFEQLFLVEDSRSYDLYDMVWKDIVNNYFSVYSSHDQLVAAQKMIRHLESAGMWKEPWKNVPGNRNCEDSARKEDEDAEKFRKKRVSLSDKQKLDLSGVAEIASVEELEDYLISHRDHFYYSILSVTSLDAFYTCLSDSGWSDAILGNFPTPEILSGIIQDKQEPRDAEPSDTELRDTALRKLLILLFFYNFYAKLRHNLRRKYRSFLHSNAPDIFGETQFSFNYLYDRKDYSIYFNEFSKNLNIELARCGFGGLYPRNPYDCLFLLAASSAHPLEALPAMLINGPPSAKPKDPQKAKKPKKPKSEA